MTTLSPSMSLLALVKTGIKLDSLDRNLRLYKADHDIVIERFILVDGQGRWELEKEFPLTGAGLKQAIDYFNLPF